MIDDLVKRLNEDFSSNAREDIQHQMKVYEKERKEAAARIEKLEAALREIIDLHYDHGPKTAEDIYVRDGMAHDIARKALKGKET